MKTVCAFITATERLRTHDIVGYVTPRRTPAIDRHEIAMQLAEDFGRSVQYWERKIEGDQ